MSYKLPLMAIAAALSLVACDRPADTSAPAITGEGTSTPSPPTSAPTN